MYRFEYLDHTADVEVRGVGDTVEEAFCAAAAGMFDLMVDLEKVSPRTRLPVEVSAPRLELLLVEWLSALLGEKEVSGLIFSRFVARIGKASEGFRLCGEGWGEPIDPSRHCPKLEVKGVSYAGLRVEERDGCWIAQCVLDA